MLPDRAWCVIVDDTVVLGGVSENTAQIAVQAFAESGATFTDAYVIHSSQLNKEKKNELET